jgi:tryptophanyl-tRNA synthetase
MEKYIHQLLSDISYATSNIKLPFYEAELNIHDWISDDEENRTAPVRNLEEWTGIFQEQLPPAEMLNDSQLLELLNALKKMLDAYNWSFVTVNEVPERIQYSVIRHNFNQQAKVKRWHLGLFEVCKENTALSECMFGEYCQCSYFKEMFADFVDEELSPEQERARAL